MMIEQNIHSGEGHEEEFDREWDDICTAMAWIREALDIEEVGE